MNKFTKEQLIEDLKASTQNASGMFEISEDTICALMSMLTSTAPQLPHPVVVPDEIPRLPDGKKFKYVMNGIRFSSNYANGWNACRAAMLQGAEPKCHDVIDKNLIEALRLVQCMLDDYRERNYGDAERWIRHINTHMSDYSEAHGNDAYSVLHDLLTAAPQQEVKNV